MKRTLARVLLAPLALGGCDFGCKGEACLDAWDQSASNTEGFPFLERGCEQGVEVACGEAARVLEFGDGVPQDTARAHTLYKGLCDAGNPEGCTSVAVMIDRGKIKGTPEQALSLMRRACDGGVARACLAEAQFLFLHGTELERAMQLAMPQCDAGDGSACGLMQAIDQLHRMKVDYSDAVQRCAAGEDASCLEALVMRSTGATDDDDAKLARAELRKRCDAGEAARCQDLGFLYSQGIIVEVDLGRAAELYHRACAGDDSLCGNYGRLYQEGRGVKQDRDQALELYTKACNADGEFAAHACGMAGNLLSEPPEPFDLAKARGFYAKACDGGTQLACANLGQMLLDGDGGAADQQKAITLLTVACDLGDGYGCANLGRAYVDGLGVPVDVNRGAQLLGTACQLGVQPACDRIYAR